MFHSVVTAYIAIMLATQAAPGLLLSLQASNTDEVRPDPALAETEAPTPDMVRVEPAGTPESNQVVRENDATAPATAGPITPQPRVTLVPKADWGPYMDAARNTLTQTKTASGRFAQINADGSVVDGTFALRRPGRMRFDYDDPSPILIVADGATVAISDSDLETIDRVPLATTPLDILLDDQISFSGDVEVLRVVKRPDEISITVRDLTGEMDGELSLIFSTTTNDLLGWVAVNSERQVTQVSLVEVEKDVSLNPALFRLEERRDEEEER